MTVVYVIIGLIIVTVVGLILSFRKFEKLREKFGDIVAYVLTSMSGILLVLLSVYLPVYISGVEDVETTKRLLANAKEDVYQTRQDVITQFGFMIKSVKAGHPAAGNIERNGLSTPRIFLRLLGNQSVLKSMNDEMLESSRRFESTMLKTVKWLSRDSISDTLAFTTVHWYGAELWKMEEILALFIASIEQDLSDSTFSAKKQVIVMRHIALASDPEIASGREQHPWLKLGP